MHQQTQRNTSQQRLFKSKKMKSLKIIDWTTPKGHELRYSEEIGYFGASEYFFHKARIDKLSQKDFAKNSENSVDGLHYELYRKDNNIVLFTKEQVMSAILETDYRPKRYTKNFEKCKLPEFNIFTNEFEA